MNKMPVNVVYAKITDPMYERMQAPVKFYSIERGYGFLKAASKNDKDIFSTAKSLEKAKIKSVQENDILEYDFQPVEGKGGKAINLKKVSK
jgi:cold shock CspA family protein